MKKIVSLLIIFIMTLSNLVFANAATASVTKLTENNIVITVSSHENIRVTGYTVKSGSNIMVGYIKDDKGKLSDNITIDLSTIAKPYKVMLVEGDTSPFIQPFKDISEHPMRDYIRHMYDMGIIKGYEEDNTFRPDNNITRAEFISLVVRTMDIKENPSSRKHFEDLNSNHWAYNDVIKAVDNGIIEGYNENGKNYIRLDKNVSIAEACKIIDEAYKIKNTSNLNYDIRFNTHWAKQNIQSLVNEKIISINDDFYKGGNLDTPAKRGIIAMLLSRTIGR